jgi:hypothetical protein
MYTSPTSQVKNNDQLEVKHNLHRDTTLNLVTWNKAWRTMTYEIQFDYMQTKVKYKSMAAWPMKLASFPLLLLKVLSFEVLKVGEERIV